MLELLAAQGIDKPPVINVTPSINTASLPRSNGSFEMVGNEILVMGGQAGLPTPYPNYGFKIDVVTTQVTQIGGYAGTMTNSTMFNGNFVTSLGHTGYYNSNAWVLLAPDFHVAYSYNTPTPARCSPTIDAYDSTHFYYGFGYNDSGFINDWWSVRADGQSQSFTRLASPPRAPGSYCTGRKAIDGKVYVIDREIGANLLRYDPYSDSWSYIENSIPPEFGIANYEMANGAMRAIGSFIFIATPHTWNGNPYSMCILRYNVFTGQFALFPLNIQARSGCGLVYHEASRTVMLVSGVLQPLESGKSYDQSARSTEVLYYSADQLMA